MVARLDTVVARCSRTSQTELDPDGESSSSGGSKRGPDIGSREKNGITTSFCRAREKKTAYVWAVNVFRLLNLFPIRDKQGGMSSFHSIR